jgi:transposase InsO family protein
MTVPIHLKPHAKPVFFKPRDVPFSRRQAVKEELERLVQEGVLEHLDYSDYAAPIVAVSKPNGKVRICGDFKMLNQQISVDQHPLPKLDELLDKLRGGVVYSKVDLADAYLQLELQDDAKKLCVINTPFGLYRYNRMCFGVASSPAQFQRCMDTMIADLPGVAAYLDDLIVTGSTQESHWKNLDKLLARLQEYGFRIRRDKCEFFKDSVEYLGHIIDKDGKRPSTSAIEAIEQLPRPQNIQELQAFLGKINYYGRFISSLSTKAAPLYKFLHKDAEFEWSSECDQAFTTLKNDVIQATQLTHYDESKPLILATDASQYGIGAALMQAIDGVERPIAHASKTLNDHQKKYSQIEKEALSIIYGVTKYRQYLYGRKFTLVTDHQPLVAIFSPDKNVPVLTAQRLQRWALTLMAYQYDIRYKSTDKHGNADGLSRLPHGPDSQFDEQELRDSVEVSHVIQEGIGSCLLDSKLVRLETQKDSSMQDVMNWIKTGTWPTKLSANQEHLRPFWNMRMSLFIHDDILLLQRDDQTRVVIPRSLVNRALDLLHTSHWGVVRMKQLSRRYAWWPTINTDIEKTVKSCTPCQETANDPARSYKSWPQTQKPWERIHLDFAGPFKGKMWLVCIDAHSRFPYVAMLDIGKTTSSDTIAVLRHIFITEGLPETIVTDNGPQFTSKEFQEFCTNHGIKHMTSPPFHPASNGEAERFVQSLKKGVEKNCAGGEPVKASLQLFLATYRCLPHPCLDWKSPAEILHGRQPRSLLSLLSPMKTRATTSAHISPKSLSQYSADSLVYARNYNSGPKWLPGKIINQLGNMMFRIRTDRGVWRRHINQLQPRLDTLEPTQPTQTEDTVTVPVSQAQSPRSPRYPRRNRRKPEFYDSSNY